VSWRVISGDSHPVAGCLHLLGGSPSNGSAQSQTRGTAQTNGSTMVGMIYAAVRTAAFASYALLVGSIGFVLLCWSGAITRRGIRRVMLVGWAGLLATTMAALLLQGPYANGLGLDRLFDSTTFSATLNSRFGTALTVRLALLALAGGYLVLLCAWLGHVGWRGRGSFGAFGVALALGLASTWATADHAAVGPQPALAIPMDVVHLLAIGVSCARRVPQPLNNAPSIASPRSPPAPSWSSSVPAATSRGASSVAGLRSGPPTTVGCCTLSSATTPEGQTDGESSM
jgi:copper transport protein